MGGREARASSPAEVAPPTASEPAAATSVLAASIAQVVVTGTRTTLYASSSMGGLYRLSVACIDRHLPRRTGCLIFNSSDFAIFVFFSSSLF